MPNEMPGGPMPVQPIIKSGELEKHGGPEIYAALIKALGEMKSVPKNGKNPHYNSRYVLLDDLQEMYRPILLKNGLGLIQSVSSLGDDYYIESRLIHSSGQSIFSRMKLILQKKDMQGLGGADTYAKRYQASGLFGIAGDEDVDGNVSGKPRVEASGPLPKKTEPSAKPAATIKKNERSNFEPAPQSMIDRINNYCIDRQVSEGVLHKLITDGYGEKINSVKTWVAIEIGKLLGEDTTTEATLMAKTQRMITEREAQRIKNEAST